MQRICAEGSCPRHQAGKAIEASSDLRWRGGRLMISRRIVPCRTAVNFAAMTSRCQLLASSVWGLRSWKQRAAKVPKSCRKTVSYSARVRFSIIGLSFLTMQPRLQLFDDLLVSRAEGGLRRCRLCPALDVLDDVDQDLGGAQ